MQLNFPVILASSSPRRGEILSRLGFTFEICPANLDEESIRHEDAATQTLMLAAAKGELVARPGCLTIAADTIVVLENTVLEKPRDQAHARTMLESLSGRAHDVFTAVHLIFPGGEKMGFLERTKVFFSELSPAAIGAYTDSPAPYDKAGGYGVQDAFGMTHIHKIEGCYFNVMGFPASRFMRALSENQKLLL